MRRSARRAAATMLAFVSLYAPALAVPPVPDTPILSGNLTLLGNIPDVAAIGGQVRTVNTVLGPKRYLVMSTLHGISAYDVTVPEAPVLAGHLPLPHVEGEDVDFGGDLLIVSQDPSFTTSLGGGLYLIDISQLPLMRFAYTNPTTGNRWTAPTSGGAGHTTSCVVASCSWAIVNGNSSVKLVDLRNPAAPLVASTISSASCSTHDSQSDAAGLVWMVGSCGLSGYDFTTPTSPKVVVPTSWGGLNYHHNSMRPRADQWAPRSAGADFADPATRPGELLMITEEEWAPLLGQTFCSGQGRFQTRRVRDTDSIRSGATPVVDTLDTWQTEGLAAGLDLATICSAHYFDERDGIVAIAWYNQGTRLLDVSNPRDIRQVGYYINRSATTWSAKWIGPGAAGGEILYTLDATRGIDILRFDRTPVLPAVTAPVLPEWLATPATPAAVTFRAHPQWGWACALPVA